MKFVRGLPLGVCFLVTCLSFSSFFFPSPVFADRSIKIGNSLDTIELPFPIPSNHDSGICSDRIEPSINKIIQRPELNQGKWAILVQSLGGTNIYSLNPDSYMVPASNMKLLVTAAALQKLDLNGQIRSTSISDWIKVTNLQSDNAYANVLLKYLGGSQSVQQALSNLGIDSQGYRLRDGSGLSRNNLATPRALVSTLRAMYHAKGNDVFFASLPVAGISGTLKNRLRHTTAEGTVRAKTGTLRGVRALSGYIDHPEYGTVVFSIITNQSSNQSSYSVVKAIDEIVLELSSFTNCY
ncbi:D-alanyl-D-alanine carboxypeptidase/D-alanyl-D-alanine-endopeptidase [Waterburya agarophytonicola K14]|uniref:D-alanyl-D-alanine carboxypeptidase/D-alanyl-D-alanine-endopeptidase n=1 Tax=Waterburya agarophytonicola KI4 TaxID=2874699 RepID=A0A964BSX2_9CYAN|nr:D-alanyl-D-alanine carboxypeptidase/D-alanyl-D-alanine-endopeptidase [Waterburya agarophytonicola]MCC0178117.1 D-alanyl-D-alanine carboxypeptidase/D-alanyl-D-alanine-endopeptidase [Waterburya agarophytonicola KI4]